MTPEQWLIGATSFIVIVFSFAVSMLIIFASTIDLIGSDNDRSKIKNWLRITGILVAWIIIPYLLLKVVELS